MKKQISKILTHLLFLQALFFQVDLPELVLCFGEDGHIAIEKAIEKDCRHDNDKFNIAYKILLAFDQKHDACNDLNLDLHFSNANVKKNKNNVPQNNSNIYILAFSKHNNNYLNTKKKIQTTTNKQTINIIHNTILLI